MSQFVVGPVANGVLTVSTVILDRPLASDIPADIVGGGQALEITQAALDVVDGNPLALVGYRFTVATGEIKNEAADQIARLRPLWLGRIRDAYVTGMELPRQWWPNVYTSSAARQRARDVVRIEIPNWWHANSRILAQAITGRAWDDMTVAQIEAAVAHYENLLGMTFAATADHPAAVGIIRRWYDVGRSLDLTAGGSLPSGNAAIDITADGAASRKASSYADPRTIGTNGSPYTDTFSINNGILTPRSPDYAWSTLADFNHSTVPANYDPENPS